MCCLENYEPLDKYKVIYVSNHKYKTAGYDKLVFKQMVNEKWANYINKRTNKIVQFAVDGNILQSSHKRIYLSVVEYFMEVESRRYRNASEQYKKELKDIQNKYPEYFI